VKSTLIKKPTPKELAQMAELKGDTIIMDDRSANRIELQNQILQLPIKNPLSLNEFLNLEDETILNKEGDIFNAIIAAYSSN